MKDRLRKWAPRIGFPLFYLISFVLFLTVVFPYDALRVRIVTTFNAQQRAAGAQQQLAIDEMGWWWFTGVRAKGVRLTSAPQTPGGPPTEIRVDDAKVRMSVLGLLIGRKDVTFRLEMLGGVVDGEYEERGKDRYVDVNLDGVELKQLDVLTQTIGLPVEGHISGNINLFMPEGKASKGSGTVNLEATDVAIGDGKAKLKGALEMPKLKVGTLTFTAEAKEGVLKITKFGAGGSDLELNGDGKVQMRELANESNLDINLKFKINDGYRGKSDITKSLFGAPGSPKGGDVELFVPEMKKAKRSDGFYAFHVRGLLAKPGFDPQGAAAGAPGGAATPFGMPGSFPP
jgi:type II secretion system protein N